MTQASLVLDSIASKLVPSTEPSTATVAEVMPEITTVTGAPSGKIAAEAPVAVTPARRVMGDCNTIIDSYQFSSSALAS
jgi:hypothetical protein